MGEIEQLVRRAKKRDPDAFTELMQLHEKDMYGCHTGDHSHLLGKNRYFTEKPVF